MSVPRLVAVGCDIYTILLYTYVLFSYFGTLFWVNFFAAWFSLIKLNCKKLFYLKIHRLKVLFKKKSFFKSFFHVKISILRARAVSSILGHHICAYFKNPTRYSDKLFQNLKRGAFSWDQLFSVHFFVRNTGKIVPPPNKNSIFCLLT